eukprot:CAMPEP_0115192826 /NCGR_PEP_ID=MMETSP0270-20121206/13239_1 /TAXON_ID=71861 /ORGANISM="Scrippsiella trochoidea, Strain CCMP3099" /LENGTH=123 /DNA_ID=CAMNT_0002606077 /DNA_START=361 /DNA_END=728 /DNA_ORIENTATION=-
MAALPTTSALAAASARSPAPPGRKECGPRRQLATRRSWRPIWVAHATSARVAASRPKMIQLSGESNQQILGTSMRGNIARYPQTTVKITAATRSVTCSALGRIFCEPNSGSLLKGSKADTSSP